MSNYNEATTTTPPTAAESNNVSASSVLYPPRLIYLYETTSSNDLECSIHTLPKPLLREFQHVFGDHYLLKSSASASDTAGLNGNDSDNLDLLAIPTNQRAREDLVNVGDHIEYEKDRLLNVFMAFGRDFCAKVRAAGYWADYIDPCSGLPVSYMFLAYSKVCSCKLYICMYFNTYKYIHECDIYSCTSPYLFHMHMIFVFR